MSSNIDQFLSQFPCSYNVGFAICSLLTCVLIVTFSIIYFEKDKLVPKYVPQLVGLLASVPFTLFIFSSVYAFNCVDFYSFVQRLFTMETFTVCAIF